MYYPYFITYVILGFTISLLVFLWALKTGQFRDQRRARFLPFHDGPERFETRTTRTSRWNRFEVIGLLFLAVAGLAASVAVLLFALQS